MKPYIYHTLLALFMLLPVEGWGLEYTINPQPGKTFPQEDVPTLVDTIYMNSGTTRRISEPNYQYYYYMRWYRLGENNQGTIENLSPTGGWNSSLTETSNNDSYFWHFKMRGGNSEKAANIKYQNNGTFPDYVYCDLSFYVDGMTINPKQNFQEPTVSKRYKFYIKNADEMRARMNAVPEGGAMETVNITVPKGARNVNLSMDMAAENYFWGNYQGGQFKVNGEQKAEVDGKRIKVAGPINGETTIEVYAATENQRNNSPCITRFILIPQENSGFMSEEEISKYPERNPEEDKKKYVQIGKVDFDFASSVGGDGVISRNALTKTNNMSATPVDPSITTYSFANPILDWINPSGYMPEDAYGLYRSANVSGISEKKGYDDRPGWGREFDSNDDSERDARNKTYGWYYTNIEGLKNKELYDRTYYNTNRNNCGYFYYVNASTEAGRVVTVPLDGIICPNTELTVTAWVADITDASILPNITLVLRGKNNNGESGVLHRFSSGDMELKNSSDRANWKQICYKIKINSDLLADYTVFDVEFQNSTSGTTGGDYAIDDIRIYRTLPNIEVNRRNACEASTLLVTSDYQTILRNMGWTEGQNVLEDYEGDIDEDLEYRKYRYGLMGDKHQFAQNSVVGNVYFAFLSEDKNTWITVNKRAVDVSLRAAKSIRVPVSTVQSKEGGFEFYTEDPERAIIKERIMNLWAVRDYNKDVEEWKKKEPDGEHGLIDVSGIGTPEKDDFNEKAYQTAIETMYHRLNIPRLRCPWYNKEEGKLYLSIIDVDNTDLQYRGQGATDENPEGASGKYWVMSFSAAEVLGAHSVNPESPCALISPFTVQPAATILIKTEMGTPETAACAGSLRKITAKLNGYDDSGNPVDLEDEHITYLFDWYLGSFEAYVQDSIGNGNVSIKTVLETYRDDTNDHDVITREEVASWTGGATPGSQQRLLELLDNNLLLTGSAGGSTFDIELPNTNKIVAMPYVYSGNTEGYVFCSECTELDLPVEELDIPVINTGFPGITYPFEGSAPLRLGLRNMQGQSELKVPVSNHKLSMAEDADHLGVSGTPEISFRDGTAAELTPVGTVTHLNIPKGYDGSTEVATITIQWNDQAVTLLKEGQEYELLFPFVQYKADGGVLDSQCDGLASLPIKVVPEYLTWLGTTSDGKWYDDTKWNISTHDEIYDKDHGVATENTPGFAPLYFSKVTIPNGQELQLEETNPADKTNWGDIQYDMAVANESGEITPYYMNKIDQIYFKPGATLLNQQLLDYTTARVDFEMKQGQAYWMSSPLKDVYAGDFYAPVSGKQETPAFEDITYKTDGTNSRWDLPFYQKAWDKGITYYTSEYGTASTSVEAVKSNWSIEYNDVAVPYTLGKGFYSRVEKNSALVRLPKADTEYKYEAATTRALNKRVDYGKLVDESFTLTLSADDNTANADGDGNHFLIGNPYMAYLDMSKFFEVNTELVEKYWAIKDGTAIVGTPDLKWENGRTDGYIAPMQAFFVERAGYTPAGTKADALAGDITVTFNTSMTVSQETVTTPAEPRTYTATNPVLQITASGTKGRSMAAVVQRSDASNTYKGEEDAIALIDSELDVPVVYTVAGNCAAALNAVQDYKNVPLGVYADAGEEVEVTISGISGLVDPLYLYDAATRSTTLLDGDTYTLNLTGASHGRYSLTTTESIAVESDIRVYSPSQGQVIVVAAPGEMLQKVQLYDVSGRLVANRNQIGQTTCQLHIPGGVYIVYVQSAQGESRVKIRVK